MISSGNLNRIFPDIIQDILTPPHFRIGSVYASREKLILNFSPCFQLSFHGPRQALLSVWMCRMDQMIGHRGRVAYSVWSQEVDRSEFQAGERAASLDLVHRMVWC